MITRRAHGLSFPETTSQGMHLKMVVDAHCDDVVVGLNVGVVYFVFAVTAVQNSLDLRYRPLKSLVIWIRFYCFENQVSFSRFSCCPNYTKDNFICSFI